MRARASLDALFGSRSKRDNLGIVLGPRMGKVIVDRVARHVAFNSEMHSVWRPFLRKVKRADQN